MSKEDKVDIVTPIAHNKAYAFDPKTGKSKVYDFDNPDPDMLRQMADVLLNRLNSPSVLKMLYIDNKGAMIPPPVREVVTDLVDNKIDQDEARKRILAWKEGIK